MKGKDFYHMLSEKARTVHKREFCFVFFLKRMYRYICRYLPRRPYIKQALVLTVL